MTTIISNCNDIHNEGKNPHVYDSTLELVRLHEDAKLPVQSQDDIGFDIFSVEGVVIQAGSFALVPTGIGYAKTPEYSHLLLSDEFPSSNIRDCRWSIETKIEGRSGLASKGIFPVGGEVDPSYRGEIKVILANFSGEEIKFEKGSKIAQLVLRPVLANTKYSKVDFEFVESQEESSRGTGGFGSTGDQ